MCDNVNIENTKLKLPKTFIEQINILKDRGLEIEDEEKSIEILKRVNYYRISAYALSLKKQDKFNKGITFQDIYNLYVFDKRLRALLMSLIETVEVAFRTHISYLIAHKYGALGYRDKNNFLNEQYYDRFIEELNKEMTRTNEKFIEHHRYKYNGQIPIWVIVEIISFGTLSKLFSNMEIVNKKSISKEYYNVPYEYIESWLKSLAFVRNVCAHHGRLYDKILVYKPKLDKKAKIKEINNEKIFSIIYILKTLITNKIQWNSFLINLQALIDEYRIVDLNLIGFPENWINLLEK